MGSFFRSVLDGAKHFFILPFSEKRGVYYDISDDNTPGRVNPSSENNSYSRFGRVFAYLVLSLLILSVLLLMISLFKKKKRI